MDKSRIPKKLLNCWVDCKRPKFGRPIQHFGHSVRNFLELRTKIRPQDINNTFNYEVSTTDDGGSISIVDHRILNISQLVQALRKSIQKGKVINNELTCIDLTLDCNLWKRITHNNFSNSITSTVNISPYDIILQNLPQPLN